MIERAPAMSSVSAWMMGSFPAMFSAPAAMFAQSLR
jgi:hypothetical protein